MIRPYSVLIRILTKFMQKMFLPRLCLACVTKLVLKTAAGGSTGRNGERGKAKGVTIIKSSKCKGNGARRPIIENTVEKPF